VTASIPAVTTDPDICAAIRPVVNTGAAGGGKTYAYNDGDGSTYYDVDYPVQMHGFDPNFHFVGMTFNPEGFADMKEKYFLLNGRSYPDTVNPDPLQTQSADGVYHFSQPLRRSSRSPPASGRCYGSRNLNVSEYQDAGLAGVADAGGGLQREAAARPGWQQPVLHDQLDHPRGGNR